MSKSSHSKQIAKIYGSVKVYKNAKQDWVYLIPTDIGDIKYSCKSIDHDGWLKCTGSAISRTDYADLFSVIGTAFGSGDGTTTFNLPDARGRVLGAIGAGVGLTTRALGDTVGSETHTLTLPEMPVHNHEINDPGHSHTYLYNQMQNVASGSDNAAENSPQPEGDTGTSFTGITIDNTGGGGAHNNMQPTEFIGHVFVFAKYLGI
jgi:microcystin-dependent protein